MIKYISAKHYLFKFDKDSENIKPINEVNLYRGHERYFILEEDGEINGEVVHSGDIVMSILDGKAIFKVPDNVANVIKDYISSLNKDRIEERLQRCCTDTTECK